jgi:spermidine/putrescine-binding protein
MAQFNPAILDKLKPDEIVDAYADMLGVAPSLIMANADVAIIRKQRAEALAKQQQLQAIQQGAETMKTMSETETPEGGNALDQITAQFSSQV